MTESENNATTGKSDPEVMRILQKNLRNHPIRMAKRTPPKLSDVIGGIKRFLNGTGGSSEPLDFTQKIVDKR